MASSPNQLAFTGRSKLKRASPSLELFSARILPPCASMIEREIGNPIPIPASLVEKKLSKRRGSVAGSNPGAAIIDGAIHRFRIR